MQSCASKISILQENKKENTSNCLNYLKSTFTHSEEETLSLRAAWEQQATLQAICTFELGVHHDVQVLPRVGAQVPGDGM